MAKLGSFGPAKVSVDGGKTWFDVPDISIGIAAPAGRANGKTAPQPLNLADVIKEVALLASAQPMPSVLGTLNQIVASVQAWTSQDDDAHETCSLTACRSPLHPGPCKGWKHTLHSIAPGAYHELEAERVRKANGRRLQRIADLKAQNKPIPRRLLEEIKPKAAPAHPAHGARPIPLGQVGQKADLAGGQAHHAGQAVSNAAGVKVKTAPPLPLGPKQKKPSVSGRGPAFVITQPKVTDQYKLDKAAKITPQEWAALSDADKATIRNELTAIKARGFGPQQKKSDELLAKLPASTAASGPTPSVANPGAVNQHPGRVTLGQAVKTPQLAAPPAPSGRGQRDQNGILVKAAPGGAVTGTSVGLPPGYRITRDSMGYSLKHNGKLIRTSSTQDALEKYAHDHAKSNGVSGTPHVPQAAPASSAVPPTHAAALAAFKDGMTRDEWQQAGGHLNAIDNLIRNKSVERSGTKTVKIHGHDVQEITYRRISPASTGPIPQAPGAPNNTPKAFAPHVQYARAVAGRALGTRPTSKNHVETYGKLTKDEFDSLDSTTQKAIRDDLANAKAKFLDPKKKQEAADLLNRFGSRHPGVPAHPKGYSDPQAEAVKAAVSGQVGTDGILKATARLTPEQFSKLDDGDRKAILGRLAFIATHPQATDEQKAKAQAFGRIINGGTHVPATQKFDHEPSIGELHAEEIKGGHAAVADALRATQQTNVPNAASPPPADRVKALTGMTKAQFQSLSPDDQRRVTDALHELHVEKATTLSGVSKLNPKVEQAFDTYTGLHPGIHRIRQAEADFRAGKLDAKPYGGFHKDLLRARVQSRGSGPGSPGGELKKETQRIAEDNPALPHWLRADMIDNNYSAPGGTYDSIAAASNPHNWEDAPRLSSTDVSNIFRANVDDLANVHPVQAEAVKALREHIIATGLKGNPGVPSGSPWSTATRNHVVDNLLHVSGTTPEVPPERLKEFDALPSMSQVLVRRVLTERLNGQTKDHAKVGTFITLHGLERRTQHSQEQTDALKEASSSYATATSLNAYRRLSPAQFDDLPPYARHAISAHLDDLQKREENSGPVRTWSFTDNPFKVMPATLKDHLNGMRTSYADRNVRAASDISNFGTKIINPYDRVRVYEQVPIAKFQSMTQGDQDLIKSDLGRIAGDAANPLPIRYNAQFTKDITHGGGVGQLSLDQITAIGAANPAQPIPDTSATNYFNNLSKAQFDQLHPAFQAAIDDRVKTLPALDQLLLGTKFHPTTVQATTPGGYTPTTAQANVPPHVQAALDTIYGVHASGKSHTMAHQLSTYGALRGSDFAQLNGQEQGHLLGDLSFIATTAKGPSADKARKLIDRFTPAGTPSGHVPTPAIVPPANAVAGQQRYATPLQGALVKAVDSGKSGDKWIYPPGHSKVWGEYGAAGLLIKHVDPNTGEERYLMVQRGPAISDPGKWTFPGGAIDSKETPHQGAARETLEELGLKNDQLKDAVIHGDHTYTIPGHPWKYTTVAAQAPTMFQPNLSTAHARAETSDAKWLTLDEIRALDKSGDLHHPIAGGKLEQNVISLYPKARQTLGQVARPGPVTSRQPRLAVPPGGRQAPGSFNAWPHAHKPSKGKDLIGDKASFDAQRQKIKNDRKLYDGKTADGRLAAIGAQQGFDDTPTVVDRKEIDRLLATGDYIEAWRGVSGAGGWSARSRGGSGGKTAKDINEEMRSGPAYYGKGIFGNGYYLATQRRVADNYSDGSTGSVVRILIPKAALTKKYDAIAKEAHANPRSSKAKGAGYGETSTFYDPGRYAAAKGLDGIEIEAHHMSPSGGAGHVAAAGRPAYNWLNRSVLIIQKEPG